METKRLYRSERNKVFAGICGGLGEYFNVDPAALRLAWLLVVIFTGFFPGVLAYILAIFVIPPAPGSEHTHHHEPQHHP
jgi:phage shock protein C